MIKTEIISSNALKIIAPDSPISQYGKIRLLIDGSGFEGWENVGAFEHHAEFITTHQQKVDRIALIASRDW